MTLFDHSFLPEELRLYALGLEEPTRPVGRPRALESFRDRFMVAAHWANTANSLARPGQTNKRPGLDPVLKQIARAKKRGLPEWRIMALSREADRIGRFHSTPILAPAETKPQIDKIVAKEFGLTERTVRTIRSDKRFIELVPQPLWIPQVWEQEIADRASVRRRARALMTPEYFAKVERGEMVIGERDRQIAVLDNLEQLAPQLTPEQYRKAQEFQARCYAGGLGDPVLGQLFRNGSKKAGPEFREILSEKISDQAPYNQAIIDRIGVQGLNFLRASLWFGDIDPRQHVLLLSQLLDQIE